MTEEHVESGAQVELEPKVGPGRDLRAARESRNLTQEAVAKQLHIDISLVRALEEDDYGRFAAPIYVTGNLRTYARLLGVAPEPLIEAYRSLGTSAAPPLERVARLSGQPEPMSSTTQVPRWVVYALTATVVVVVILIWRSEVTKLLAPIMESSSGPEMSLQAVPNGEGLALPAQRNGGTPQQSLSLPASADGKADQAASAAEVTDATPSPPQPDLPRATLSLKSEKPSWVEVRDGSGKRLFYDLMVPGDAQSIEGEPPFDILLGYAPGVIVEYNGKRVDHSAYARQDMARFRVGDKGTSKN